MIVTILLLFVSVLVSFVAVLWNNPVPMAAFIVFGTILYFHFILIEQEKKLEVEKK